MRDLFWTRRALRDRETIYNYIESENPTAALALDGMFAARAESLAAHPALGRPGRVWETRELIVHRRYVLVYAVLADEVRILRVLHTARDRP